MRPFLTAKHPLRDKTLWWLLYDSAARASEILALDVDHLYLPRRRALVIGKDTRAELIGWETTTARLLPRLLQRRRHGPVFLTAIAPAPARQPALADLDPDTGRARPSYRRAAEVFKDASNGWTPHQLRHSRLTHLAEAGLQLPMLMTKSRHTSLTSLAIYVKPTFDAVAAATAAIDPAADADQPHPGSLPPTECSALRPAPHPAPGWARPAARCPPRPRCPHRERRAAPHHGLTGRTARVVCRRPPR